MTPLPTTRPVLTYPVARTCPHGPWAGHEEVRDEGPVSAITLFDGTVVWLVTGRAEGRQVLGDHRVFSSNRQDPRWPILVPRLAGARNSGSIVALDPPAHTAQRRVLIPSFTAARLSAMRPGIQEVVDRLLDAVAEQGPPADLVAGLAQPLPSTVICQLLGVPYADHEFFERQSRRFINGNATREEAANALGTLKGYISELIDAKQRTPGTGLLDEMIAGRVRGTVPDRDYFVDMAMSLLIAGHETTANAIAIGILTLLTHPDQLAAVRADPDRLRGAVEEVLRVSSVVDAVVRLATEDTELAGRRISAGDGVVVALSQINRDAAAFDEPDTFDTGRGARGHVTFGHGIHQCIGANLARIELEIAIGAVLARFPTLRLAVEADQIVMKDPGAFHGVVALPVTW